MAINLGNVTGMIVSATPPKKKYVLWAKQVASAPLRYDVYYFDGQDLSSNQGWISFPEIRNATLEEAKSYVNNLIEDYYTKEQSDDMFVTRSDPSGGGVHPDHVATPDEIHQGLNNAKVITPKGLYDSEYIVKQNQIAFAKVSGLEAIEKDGVTIPRPQIDGITGAAVVYLERGSGEDTFKKNEKIETLLFHADDSYGNSLEGTIDVYKKGVDEEGTFSAFLRQKRGDIEVKILDVAGVAEVGNVEEKAASMYLMIATKQDLTTETHPYDGNISVEYYTGFERDSVLSKDNKIYNTADTIYTPLAANWSDSKTKDVKFETDFAVNDKDNPFVVIDKSKPTHLIGKTDGIVYNDLPTEGVVDNVNRDGSLDLVFGLPIILKVDQYVRGKENSSFPVGYLQIARINSKGGNNETYSIDLKWTQLAEDKLVNDRILAGDTLHSDRVVEVDAGIRNNHRLIFSTGRAVVVAPEVGLLTEINPISSPTYEQKRDGARTLDTYVTDPESGVSSKLSSHQQDLYPGGLDLRTEAKPKSGTRAMMADSERYNRTQSIAGTGVENARYFLLGLRFARDGTIPSGLANKSGTPVLVVAYRVILFLGETAWQCHVSVFSRGLRDTSVVPNTYTYPLRFYVESSSFYALNKDDDLDGYPSWKTRVKETHMGGGYIMNAHKVKNTDRLSACSFNGSLSSLSEEKDLQKSYLELNEAGKPYFGIFFGNAIALGQQEVKEGTKGFRNLAYEYQLSWLKHTDRPYSTLRINDDSNSYRVIMEELFIQNEASRLYLGGVKGATGAPKIGEVVGQNTL